VAEPLGRRLTEESNHTYRVAYNAADMTDTTSAKTRFRQTCPTCGRRVLIRIQYLGIDVRCRHCGRVFFARDESQECASATVYRDTLLEKANRLLAARDHQLINHPK